MKAPSDEPYLLSRQEAARRYGISLRMLDNLYKADPTFPTVKIGRRVLIHRDMADEWFTEYIGAKGLRHPVRTGGA